MTDPSLIAPDPELDALFRVERRRPESAVGNPGRVWSGLQRELGLGGFPDGSGSSGDPGTGAPPDAPTAPTTPAASTGGAIGATTSLKSIASLHPLVTGAIGFLAGGVSVGSMVAALSGPTASMPTPSQSSSSMLQPISSASAPAVSSSPVAEVSAVPARSGVSAAPSPSMNDSAGARSTEQSLDAERAMLEAARVAVLRGNGSEALAALSKHAKAFPSGRLTEEREALWVQAMAASGRSAEARQRAELFRKRFPQSFMVGAVEAAAGGPASSLAVPASSARDAGGNSK